MSLRKAARHFRLMYLPGLRKGTGIWGFKGGKAIQRKVRRESVW